MNEHTSAYEQPAASGALRRRDTVASLASCSERASAVLVGQACGDALGVPYEFVSPKLQGHPEMIGGGLGNYQPGEWSDDTQLSICLAEITATGVDITLEETLDEISTRYIAALRSGVSELDAQTQVVFDSVLYDDVAGRPAQKMRRAAAYFHRRTSRSAGNGALARTPIMGLTRIYDREWTAASARTVAELTHVDPLAGDACVLVAETIRQAVTDPDEAHSTWRHRLRLDAGIDLLPQQRQHSWTQWLSHAASTYYKPPIDNSFTVTAMQAVVAAIVHAVALAADTPAQTVFRTAVEQAVRTGGDTDTIAAVTGAIMAAVLGPTAIPRPWRRRIHGWPGLDSDGLEDLAIATTLAGVLGSEKMAELVISGADLRQLFHKSAGTETVDNTVSTAETAMPEPIEVSEAKAIEVAPIYVPPPPATDTATPFYTPTLQNDGKTD